MKNNLKAFVVIMVLATAFVSCKKGAEVKPQTQEEKQLHITDDVDKGKSNYEPRDTNPYPPVSNPVVGGAAYYYVKDIIPSGSTNMVSYAVYSNPVDGKPYSSESKLYYAPAKVDVDITFGSNATGSTSEFKTTVNAEIQKYGYALVEAFVDGGKNNYSFKLYGTTTW